MRCLSMADSLRLRGHRTVSSGVTFGLAVTGQTGLFLSNRPSRFLARQGAAPGTAGGWRLASAWLSQLDHERAQEEVVFAYRDGFLEALRDAIAGAGGEPSPVAQLRGVLSWMRWKSPRAHQPGQLRRKL
jgi:hypothetical protein